MLNVHSQHFPERLERAAFAARPRLHDHPDAGIGHSVPRHEVDHGLEGVGADIAAGYGTAAGTGLG